MALIVLLILILLAGGQGWCAERLDRYGGIVTVGCRKGRSPHFYTEKIGNRWWLCDPAGHGFFMKGVTLVGFVNASRMESKYGHAWNPYVVSSAEDPQDVWVFNLAIQQIKRLQAWGFNELADDAWSSLLPTNIDVRWSTADHTIPSQFRRPFNTASNLSYYAFANRNGCGLASPIKDMLYGLSSALQPKVYYNYGDYFDPYYSTCANNILNPATHPTSYAVQASAVHNDYLVYMTLDEQDQLGGLLGDGPDFPTIDSGGNQNPVGASDYFTWVVLATSPSQTAASHWGVSSYSDKEVYSKVQLANDLANKYVCTAKGSPLLCCTGKQRGTCSVDPASVYYIGPDQMAAATTALNEAWGSHYTGLGTSDARCATNLSMCLQSGTYSSMGNGTCYGAHVPLLCCTGNRTGTCAAGTGLLDENGDDTSFMGDARSLAGETPAMQADLKAFYVHALDQYLGKTTQAFHTYAPGILLQMIIGGWGAPPRKEVLIEAAKYLDLPQLTVPPNCPTCTDIQQRIDFVSEYLGDKPWMMWEGAYANPDSAESQNVRAGNIATTQAGRGIGYNRTITNLIKARDNRGIAHVVGFFWWAMYDSNREGLNWGLCTPSDNPYDGKSATVAGVNGTNGRDQWGYRTGGEQENYGDFIAAVKATNGSLTTALEKSIRQSRGSHQRGYSGR
jgi:hypothetical protein